MLLNLTRTLERKGIPYPVALRVTRKVLEARRTREFYSLELTPSAVTLYTESGKEFIFPLSLRPSPVHTFQGVEA